MSEVYLRKIREIHDDAHFTLNAEEYRKFLDKLMSEVEDWQVQIFEAFE